MVPFLEAAFPGEVKFSHDPEQAEIVKQIFADTLAGKSTHAIADELNKRGVATKRGGHWTPRKYHNE